MDRSIIVTRYARALVKYVGETGHGPLVSSEADVLARTMDSVPELGKAICSKDVLPSYEKKKLIAAVFKAGMSHELDRFVDLLLKNGRIEMLRDILRDFTELYWRSVGVRQATLITAVPAREQLLQRLRAVVRSRTGDDLRIKTETDPDLIGGFVFDMGDTLLDASVKRQLEIIGSQLAVKNTRII